MVSGAGGNGFNVFQLTAPATARSASPPTRNSSRSPSRPTSLVVDGVRADTNTVFDSVTLGQPRATAPPPTAPTGLDRTVNPARPACRCPGRPAPTTSASPDTRSTATAPPPRSRRSPGPPITDTGLTPSTTLQLHRQGRRRGRQPVTGEQHRHRHHHGRADTTAPTAPSGLTAGQPGSTSVPLSWTAATDNVGVTGYEVYRNHGATPVQTVTGTAYTDTGLTPSTSYSYTVKAVDAAGNRSPASNTATATTAAGGNVITLTPTNDATIDPVTTNPTRPVGSRSTAALRSTTCWSSLSSRPRAHRHLRRCS